MDPRVYAFILSPVSGRRLENGGHGDVVSQKKEIGFGYPDAGKRRSSKVSAE